MEIHKAIWLAITEGLSEFLPVGSSGTIRLMQEILSDRVELLIGFLYLGALLAVVIYCHKQIAELFCKNNRKNNLKQLLNILLASIPTTLAVIFLPQYINQDETINSIFFLAVAMGILGIILVNLERIRKKVSPHEKDELNSGSTLGLGLVRAVSVLPGTSGFSIAIITARLAGLKFDKALKLSLISCIPILTALSAQAFFKEGAMEFLEQDAGATILGILISFLCALFVLVIFSKFFKKHKTMAPFGWVQILLALLVLSFELIK